MEFNYGHATNKFRKNWSALRCQYLDAGMSYTDIRIMQDFDWDCLKSERRFRTHNQYLDGAAFFDGDEAEEDQSPLLEDFFEQLSVGIPEVDKWGRYDWVEEIDTPELASRLKALPKADLELLTFLTVDDMSRADISRELCVSRAAVTKRLNRIKKLL